MGKLPEIKHILSLSYLIKLATKLICRKKSSVIFYNKKTDYRLFHSNADKFYFALTHVSLHMEQFGMSQQSLYVAIISLLYQTRRNTV